MSEEPLYHCLSLEEWVKVTSALSYSEVKVFYYLLCQNPMGDRQIDCRVRVVAKAMGMSTGAVSTAIKQLEVKGFLPKWVSITENGGTEAWIRNRLKSQLGGLTEVVTPAGRIDLLTETEVIEIKHLPEWKSAMGQVLAYSGFYPEHRKRIHLFGKNDDAVIATAMAICLELDITVTFEEVE